MEIINGTVWLKDAVSLNPTLSEFSNYRDEDGNDIMIPNALVVRLYCLLEYESKQAGMSPLKFIEWQKELVNERTKNGN